SPGFRVGPALQNTYELYRRRERQEAAPLLHSQFAAVLDSVVECQRMGGAGICKAGSIRQCSKISQLHFPFLDPLKPRSTGIHRDFHPPSYCFTAFKSGAFTLADGLLQRIVRAIARFESDGKLLFRSASLPSTLAYPDANEWNEAGIETKTDAFIFSRQEEPAEPFGQTIRKQLLGRT